MTDGPFIGDPGKITGKPPADEIQAVLTVVFLAAGIAGRAASGQRFAPTEYDITDAEKLARTLVDRWK